MTTPRISVVVPAYNNARTLAETLRSVLDQQVEDLELIVADHASADDTWEVMQAFDADPRVTLLRTEGGGGAVRNWNRVTDAASGAYVKLVCGDDVLRPGVLARQARLLEETGAVLTASKRDIVDASGKVVMGGWGLTGLGRAMSGADALRRTVRAGRNLLGEPASVMMRREALAAAGGWHEDFSYFLDLASYARVLVGGGFTPDLEVGATFRMSDGQWSVALVDAQRAEARRFSAWLRTEHPDIVTEADRRMGDIRAGLMAQARRVSYRVLKRRMG